VKAAALLVLALLAAVPVAAQQPPTPAPANDRHAGYYYPPPVSRESYVSRARVLIDADRAKRLDFVNGLTNAQMSLPYRPFLRDFRQGRPGGQADHHLPRKRPAGHGLSRARIARPADIGRALQPVFRRSRGRGSIHLPRSVETDGVRASYHRGWG
jgi:hypothetical protein